MPQGRLDVVVSTFNTKCDALHERFLTIVSDAACAECSAAGFGEAILTAWLQTEWGNFTHDLVIASALGTRRASGNPVRPATGARSPSDVKRILREVTPHAIAKLGLIAPVWHSTKFVIEVSNLLGLRNLQNLEAALGSTVVPNQISEFRNYLVHPNRFTRSKYESLQAKLGLHGMEPEDLLHQQHRPGVTVFTHWVRALQGIAYASTR